MNRVIATALILLCGVSAIPICVAPATAADNYYNSGLEETAQQDNKISEKKAAPAEDEDKGQSYGRQVITPVSSCLDKLPEEDAVAIRRTSIKPYEDCQKKVLMNEKEKKETKARKKTRDEEAETPRNFLRVTEETQEAPEDKAEEEEKPAPKTKIKKESFN